MSLKLGRALKPLSAIERFSLNVRRRGLIDATPAFAAFRHFDKHIEDLDVKYGAVAADLATGEEISLTKGSVVDAARASSAIPVLFNAVRYEDKWLVDGALANPAPVGLARELGANFVISVDLNASPRVLDRFEANAPRPIATDRRSDTRATPSDPVAKLIAETQLAIRRQFERASANTKAAPKLFETAYAAADIFQMQLARARTKLDPPDLLLMPNMRDATPMAFDRADEFIEAGKRCLLEKRAIIEDAIATNAEGDM